jgi:hypothetical protein
METTAMEAMEAAEAVEAAEAAMETAKAAMAAATAAAACRHNVGCKHSKCYSRQQRDCDFTEHLTLSRPRRWRLGNMARWVECRPIGEI